MGTAEPLFTNPGSAELYRRESIRLRCLAARVKAYEVRNELLRIAREYEVLASHNAAFGRRFADEAMPEAAKLAV